MCRVWTAQSQLSQSLTPESSLGDSDSWEQSCPGSLDVIVLIGNAEDDGSEEEETISLPGFLKSDTEEVRVAAACMTRHAWVMYCMPHLV